MNGAGNDFILLENFDGAIDRTALPRIARQLCNRRLSIGADGLMVLVAADGEADFRMLFYNSDGSAGEMCGNGARCICRYGYERGLCGQTQRVETTAGLVTGTRITRSEYRIALNLPSVMTLQMALPLGGDVVTGDYVELGSPGIPHLAVCCPDLAQRNEDELRALGRALRFHPTLSRGANVDFYELTASDTLLVKPYERGVEDFTLACGTGAGATVAALTVRGLVSGKAVRVQMQGGVLRVDTKMEHGAITQLLLTGPTRLVAQGDVMEDAFWE